MWKMWNILGLVLVSLILVCDVSADEDDFNNVNPDGSFAFRHKNVDIGGHYHTASGTPNNVVRGRYGSRNAATGRIDETVYTAGPRGYRARGPAIHRKMDLSQIPRGPIGSIDDPLADPYEDPSYGFGFRTQTYQRREDADSTGRVRGLYSFIDDIGEKHTVRYAAGQGTGFVVTNAVPDSPASVAFNAPLYKAPKQTRGKIAYERGPGNQYRFISSGPDQRRSETSTADGIVRGSYSYLDDKGVERTVQYIAGPGIGYRVVKMSVGSGTHLEPRPSIPELGIHGPQSNEFPDTDDGLFNAAESGGIVGGSNGFGGSGSGFSKPRPVFGVTDRPVRPGGNYGSGNKPVGSGANDYGSGSYGGSDNGSGSNGSGNTFGSSAGVTGGIGGGPTGTTYEKPGNTGNKPTTGYGHTGAGDKNDGSFQSSGPTSSGEDGYEYAKPKPPTTGYEYNKPKPTDSGYEYNKPTPSSTYLPGNSPTGSKRPKPNQPADFLSNSNEDYDYGTSHKDDKFSTTHKDSQKPNRPVGPPYVSGNRVELQNHRDSDWVHGRRDSTIIKNVGDWYVGLPPGSSVRAHVQNIDLLPLGGRRSVSPSEALKRDEDHDSGVL